MFVQSVVNLYFSDSTNSVSKKEKRDYKELTKQSKPKVENSKSFKCDIDDCNKCLVNKYSLKRHKRVVHRDVAEREKFEKIEPKKE